MAKRNHVTQEQTASEGTTPEPAAKELSTQELMTKLQDALTAGDYKAVASVSRQIDIRERATEKAEVDAKRAELDAMSADVKNAIKSVVEPLVMDGKLDKADGIWFTWDFGEQDATVRLMKTQARAARTGGGGTGKKFDISTDDMLNKNGSQEYKDDMTYRQAYDQNTDKNWRYAIRQKLLKLEGII